MSKKTLNKENLQKLSPETLAGLVMDLVQGSAALQRRARMELSAAQGPKDVAADIRKRFASLRRSTSYIDWRQQRALVKDLDGLLRAIESNIAATDASEAFELLWSFLQLAPSIYERTDDSNGAVGRVMADAVDLIAAITPRLSPDPETLAERILEAVAEAGYGEFDGIIPATAEALGAAGLDHLKQITEAWAAQPPTTQDLNRYTGHGFSTSPEEIAYRQKQGTRSIILADIADAQGDVDAYMARYSEEQLTYATIAPAVARRLLDAGRIEEALGVSERARAAEGARSFIMFDDDLDEVYEECLEKLGKADELKDHLWNTFQENLNKRSLRKYLKLLPDFEDIEAEQKALDYAEAFSDTDTAISFLVDWPAHQRAARAVLARANDLDGNSYHILTTSAAALEPQYPLAATLMRRAMIQDTLDGGKSKRYRYAARYLADCQSCDASIADYGQFPTHGTFVQDLKQKHGRKYAFWQLVDG